MNDAELIKKWNDKIEIFLSSFKKNDISFSKNLEKSERYFCIERDYGFYDFLSFIIFEFSKLQKNFDVLDIMEDYIKYYKKNKFKIYKDFINCKKELQDIDLTKYVEEFINIISQKKVLIEIIRKK